MKLKGIYPVEDWLKLDGKGNIVLSGHFENVPITRERARQRFENGTFTGLLVGPSGFGKTHLLNSILSDKNSLVEGKDVDVDGLRPRMEKAFIDRRGDGKYEEVNFLDMAVCDLIQKSNIEANTQTSLIRFWHQGITGEGRQILNEDEKDVIEASNIPDEFKRTLRKALLNSKDRNDLSAVTLAYEMIPEARELYDDEEGRLLLNYSTGNGSNNKSLIVAAPGSACTQSKSVIGGSLEFATWINLQVAKGSDQWQRAISQMDGKPIDRKGMTDEELMEYRFQIFKALGHVDIPFSLYRKVKDYRSFVELVLSKLEQKERRKS